MLLDGEIGFKYVGENGNIKITVTSKKQASQAL